MNTRLAVLFLSAFALFVVGCQAQTAPATTETPGPVNPSPLPSASVPAPSPSPQVSPISGPQAGSSMLWVDGSTLVYIPAGEFVMGDGAADAPLHMVRLSAYWIQQSEVTNAMYAACVRAGACKGLPSLTEAGGEERPVTGVTWVQARNYCDWIQGRLPTEAEWERAAQGLAGSIYPWGSEAPDCEHANFGSCRRVLKAIGGHRQGNSPLGLFDMAGNAAEWVRDWYDPNYYRDSPSDDPVGPPAGEVRVVRGGSYASSATQISAYSRAYEWPRRSRADLGFRCVVPSPILYPPYCQVPAVTDSSAADSCQPPSTQVRGSYCQQKKGYVSLDIPAGARWRVETPRFNCSAMPVSSSVERLVCYGQGNLDFQVTVCSGECFGSKVGLSPVCPAGYTLDVATGACIYTLAPADSCPQDFVRLNWRGEEDCIPGAIGKICPVGHYWDAGAGGCLPPGDQTVCLIYGRLSADAEKCYQGCPLGSTYDVEKQCCQSKVGITSKCPAGYIYDPLPRACISGAGFSSEGCVTVTLRTGACVDCGVYPNCVPGCKPDKKTQTCIMR